MHAGFTPRADATPGATAGRNDPAESAGSASDPSALQQRGGDRHDLRTEILAEALRLRVAAERCRDAVAEETFHHEVQREQVRELEALDLERPRLAQELAETLDGEVLGEPAIRGRCLHPDADVAVAALVARP